MAEGGKSNTLLIVIIVVAMQLIATVGIMFFIMKKMNSVIPANQQQTQTQQNNEQQQSQNYVTTKPQKKKNSGSSVLDRFGMEGKDYEKEFAIYNNKELTSVAVNIKGTPGSFVAVTLGFEYRQADKDLAEELNMKIQLVKNNLIEYLGSIDQEKLLDIDYRSDVIKEDIKIIINNIATKGQISRVLFTQFVVQ